MLDFQDTEALMLRIWRGFEPSHVPRGGLDAREHAMKILKPQVRVEKQTYIQG